MIKKWTPIEAMAKAFLDAKWLGCSDAESMRAALIVLEHTDFYVPDQIVGELAEVNGEVVKVDVTISPYASITVFRNLIRSISASSEE